MAQSMQARSHESKSRQQRSGFAGLPRLDYMFLGAVGTLTLLGLMLVYSGSYDLAYITQEANAAYYVARQIVFLAIGVVVMFLLARSDYMSWRRWSVLLMGGAALADGGAAIVGANGVVLIRGKSGEPLRSYADPPAGIIATALPLVNASVLLIAGENGLSSFEPK